MNAGAIKYMLGVGTGRLVAVSGVTVVTGIIKAVPIKDILCVCSLLRVQLRGVTVVTGIIKAVPIKDFQGH